MRPRSSCRLASACALAIVILCFMTDPARSQATLPTGFQDQLLTGGFDFPAAMAALPDGRVFVVEQKSSKIRLIVNGAISAVDPVCVVDAVQTTGNEQGLIGIAVDPEWPYRPYVYIHCDDTTPTNTIRISRYTVTGDLFFAANGALLIDVASRYDLINSLPDVASNHNGGTLRFGPEGYLYDSMGDDGGGCVAQDDYSLRGVIMRLDTSRLPPTPGGPPSLDLITPPDNPQIGASDPRTRLIYSYGLRNPFRFAIDPLDGTLYIGDVGESDYEEIDRAAFGSAQNFGWSHFEGFAIKDASCDTTSPTRRPIWVYDRTSYPMASVIFGAVYHVPSGATHPFPSVYEGDLFFSDYYVGFLRRLKGRGNSWSIASTVAGQPNSGDWATGLTGVSDYFIASDGSIWYCRQHVNFAGNSGQIRRIIAPENVGDVPPEEVRTAIGPSYPEPARGFLTLPVHLAVAGRVEVSIFDVNGRRVRNLVHDAWRPAGASESIVWDGLDDERHPVAAGVYLARLHAAGIQRSCRVTLLR